MQLKSTPGNPSPLGPSIHENTINFALYSSSAAEVTLCLFDRETKKPYAEFPFSPETNKTENIWHIALEKPETPTVYAYKITPPINEHQHYLLDPYAKSVSTTTSWGKNNKSPGKQSPYAPLADLPLESSFDWENDSPPQIPLNNLIIYEMSVRAFTQDPSSKVEHPGTFLGVIEKIPHLVELGVNAVELLPLQEFNECEYTEYHPNNAHNFYNFWGYSTVNFFSPMNRFTVSNAPGASINEFKTMVKKLHQHGIEIILDVVFNHTAEGNENGPVLSFKGIDNATYYLMDEQGAYLNYSGCGNTLNATDPAVITMIVDCLCYWVTEMHVDGFRFDLASTLSRGKNGAPIDPSPLITAITSHPTLSKIKLIAEPWDAGGLYQVGHFAPETKRWTEWNDRYRDGIRRFIKGTAWTSGDFATRLCGSEDLYHNRGPCNSLNFITCHDGFTLSDLVSYNSKHNINNGEENRDGHSENQSWNCGEEGPTTNKKILALREKQMKNFHLALMLSQGVPMVLMGDEYGHTKGGNNNTWCQDNKLNWFLWDKLHTNAAFYRFYKKLIYFRKRHSILRRHHFLTHHDVDWHGIEPFKPDWNNDKRFVALTLKDHKNDHNLFIAFNAQNHIQQVHLPPPPYAKRWRWVVNTANPSPSDFYEDNEGPIQVENTFKLAAYSAIVLQAS